MKLTDHIPVLLVGAGAAGVSAAIWLDDFDVSFAWIDASGSVGGILTRVHNRIDNYPGDSFDDGTALARKLQAHVQQMDLALRPARLKYVELSDDGLVAELETEDRLVEIAPDRLVLATGTKYRRLQVPGEKEGLGRWVSQSAMADAPRFAGRPVAVVGGGDSGFENALVLAGHGCQVTLLLRNPEFRARPAFVRKVREHDLISIAPIPSTIERIERSGDGCRLFIDERGSATRLEVAAVFVRIGVDPVIPDGCEQLSTDDGGFIVVDESAQTSADRIFAAGDVTATSLRSVATSVSDGARAARSCAESLGIL